MSTANQELTAFRRTASALSGGRSGNRVHDMILRMCAAHGLAGRVCDLGAGKGDLLKVLSPRHPEADFTGIDLMERPDDIDPRIGWHTCDLNDHQPVVEPFDTVICCETIEHLENPRATMRLCHRLLKPGGRLILSTPNNESIRSYVSLVLGGHFADFRGSSYPAHITALLRLDLLRLCEEAGFTRPTFHYTDYGGIPGSPHRTWQWLSLGLLRGRLFSDNVGLVAERCR